jgi:putative membrane protein insertion efficiency factor
MTNAEAFSWHAKFIGLLAWSNRFLVGVLSALVWLYRWLVSPWLGPRCRFLPSCSAYMLQALAVHGAFRGVGYGLLRLCRCHPWGGSKGYCLDPVPERVSPSVSSFF